MYTLAINVLTAADFTRFVHRSLHSRTVSNLDQRNRIDPWHRGDMRLNTKGLPLFAGRGTA